MAEQSTLVGASPLMEVQSLCIRLKGIQENEVCFNVDPRDELSAALAAAYCEPRGIDEHSRRFFFENHRIAPGDTPKALEMEDQDMIDVHEEQLGGAVSAEVAALFQPTRLTVSVQDESGGAKEFSLKFTTRLEHLMNAYCLAKRMHPRDMRFFHDGYRIKPNDTAEGKQIRDCSIIYAFQEQRGGGGGGGGDDAPPGPPPDDSIASAANNNSQAANSSESNNHSQASNNSEASNNSVPTVSSERPPEPEPVVEVIDILVRSKRDEEHFFRIRKNTRFRKLLDTPRDIL